MRIVVLGGSQGTGHALAALAVAAAANPQVGEIVKGVSDSAGALISELSANPATAHIAEAAREALTQGVSVAAFVGVTALIIGFLTTIPLAHQQKAAAAQRAEEEAAAAE